MKQRRTTIWALILFGLALQLICGPVGRSMPEPANIFTLLATAGTVGLLIGCAACAEEKGYSRNYGVLALLSFMGVILLALLPRRDKD